MINIYNQKEIGVLKEGGRILALILDQLVREAKEEVTKTHLNEKAKELIKKADAKPSFLGYRNFPAALCVSVNDELVHGVPKDQTILRGDLVSLDLGIRWKGLCIDKAVSFLVGERDKEKQKFLETVKKTLNLAIKKAKVGHHLGEVSATIQKTLTEGGYSVVTVLSGHGVGKMVHEEPKVPNFGKETEGPILKEGMVLAIEPMSTMRSPQVRIKEDGFTVSSKDGSLSAHFEDTIAITKRGPVILTRS